MFVASLFFYAWGEPVYIAIMLLSTATDHTFGLWLDRPGQSVVANLSLLSYFKYVDFLIGNINDLFGAHLPLTDLPLPIGISFYRFLSMSYIIDVYVAHCHPQMTMPTAMLNRPAPRLTPASFFIRCDR
ncbi:hypothetical protein H7C19_12685 [Cohnella nanjingensis]|uniref:Uncharacterized protein n=1 Tax=Cohnella nanjingensis TaxID=1387779 RepID=A0A7X0RST0_9BACL|nr:hypothetical protein [Cohnella nanjingensis]